MKVGVNFFLGGLRKGAPLWSYVRSVCITFTRDLQSFVQVLHRTKRGSNVDCHWLLKSINQELCRGSTQTEAWCVGL